MKYVSNFHQEVGGKQYAPGDEITASEETEGALDYLARDGRVTKLDDGDPEVSALGGDDETETAVAEESPALSGMNKDELVRQAALEGVQIETDDNKADIVRKIEAARG